MCHRRRVDQNKQNASIVESSQVGPEYLQLVWQPCVDTLTNDAWIWDFTQVICLIYKTKL